MELVAIQITFTPEMFRRMWMIEKLRVALHVATKVGKPS